MNKLKMLILVTIFFSCSLTPPNVYAEKKPVDPFKVILEYNRKELHLSAYLENISDKDQLYTTHYRWFLKYILMNSKGEEIKAKTNEHKKRVQLSPGNKESFKHLEPGKKVLISQAKFNKNENSYYFRWAHYFHEELLSGIYKLKITFSSTYDSYREDMEEFKLTKLDEYIWLGTVSSKVLSFEIP